MARKFKINIIFYMKNSAPRNEMKLTANKVKKSKIMEHRKKGGK